MQTGGAEMSGEDSGEELKDTGSERRGDARYETDADSVVLMIESSIETDGRVENLSLSGCRVEIATRIPAVAGMHVEVAFKVHREALRLGGVVQWFDGQRHIGVRFGVISDRRKEALNAVIEELAEAELFRTGLIEGLDNSGEISAQKVDQAEHDRPVEGESMELATTTQAADQYAERRHYPRQPMHAVAAIYPIELGGKLNAWILNLSLGGCRLQLEEQASVDLQVRVEVGFFYEGMPFRVAGLLHGSYAPQEVGIKFVEVSERNQKRLESLIQELEQRALPGGNALCSNS